MTQQQFDQLMALLGNIGSAAYQSAYAQAVVNGKVDSFFAGVAAVVVVIAVVVIWHNARQVTKESVYEKDQWHIGVCIIALIAGTVAVLLAVALATSAFSEIMNPSWAAIQLLAGLVKK